MTIQRHKPGQRMSSAVCVGGLCYLAGQVPKDLSGDISQQTTLSIKYLPNLAVAKLPLFRCRSGWLTWPILRV